MTEQTILDYIYRIAHHTYPDIETLRENQESAVKGAIEAYRYKQILDAIQNNTLTQARLNNILADSEVQRQRLINALKRTK